MTINQRVGAALRALRERDGLHGTELADRMGTITQGRLYAIERGERGIQVTTLDQILRAGGWTWRQLAIALEKLEKSARTP